jgi:hypothetical protein
MADPQASPTMYHIQAVCARAAECRDQAKILRSSSDMQAIQHHRIGLKDCIAELRDLEAEQDKKSKDEKHIGRTIKNLRMDLEANEEGLKNVYYGLRDTRPE